MTIEKRLELINKIEKKRGSTLIAYITSDRINLATNIADDAPPLLRSHLQDLGRVSQLDLFLSSPGGFLMSPLRIVNLLRSYCNTFYVLVPHHALSAATMICLGADGIIMGKMGELGPVDPSTVNEFNQQDPLNPKRRIPISVEDVSVFLALAKEKAGLTGEDKMLEVFKALTGQVHSIALGNVYRVYNEIRDLVPKLLSLHMDPEEQKETIESIRKALTELYTHDYPIFRDEAERLKLKITKPDEELESLMWNLYEEYAASLNIQEPFNPDRILGAETATNFSFETAYIESRAKTHAYMQEGTITRPPPPPGQPGPPSVTVRFTLQQWKQLR